MTFVRTAHDHLTRRTLLKGVVGTATGAALANWGGLFNSQTIAQEAQRQGKRCILLWMAGGPSHIDTFDMKPGRPTGGPFRPISTNVPGIQVCEYLPRIARQVDKLAIIRSMSTTDPGHSTGTYLMHTGYPREAFVRHPGDRRHGRPLPGPRRRRSAQLHPDRPGRRRIEPLRGRRLPRTGVSALPHRPHRVAAGEHHALRDAAGR